MLFTRGLATSGSHACHVLQTVATEKKTNRILSSPPSMLPHCGLLSHRPSMKLSRRRAPTKPPRRHAAVSTLHPCSSPGGTRPAATPFGHLRRVANNIYREHCGGAAALGSRARIGYPSCCHGGFLAGIRYRRVAMELPRQH
jgi:hypothetical protein